MLNPESLKPGQWFLLRNNTCAEFEAFIKDERVQCPVVLKDKDGDLIPYDVKGRHLMSPESVLNIQRTLPPATSEVSLRNVGVGQMVLFRDHTLGRLEALPDMGARGHQYHVRSFVDGKVTLHSSHGWAWSVGESSRDIIVCFEASPMGKRHKANVDSLRKMIERLAQAAERQTKEERALEFERARAGILHLFDKMESDLNET